MKIVSVLGTRPEAIKLAPLCHALDAHPGIEHLVCATGQHGDLLLRALGWFGLAAEHRIEEPPMEGDLGGRLAAMVSGVSRYLCEERPDLVLVQGDTASTLAGALAAHYAGLPIGHVEAGLRSGDLGRPWPEEGSRKMVSAVATLHFAPTEANRLNLLAEGVSQDAIFVTGNTIVDALALTLGESRETVRSNSGAKRLIVVTAHRRENLGDGLRRICDAAAALGRRGDLEVAFVLHPNPMAREPARRWLGAAQNVRLLEPLDYPDFVRLLARCDAVLTDSGGVHEEAVALGKPVAIAREATERPEGLGDRAILVGADALRLARAIARLLESPSPDPARPNPFGDGRAAERIVAVIEDRFGVRSRRVRSASAAVEQRA